MAPAVEDSLRVNLSSLVHSSSRHKYSGYEPSDTETEWQESPWNDGLLISNEAKTISSRTVSPISVRSRTPNPSKTNTSVPSRSKTPNPSRTINHISNRSKTPDPTRTVSPLSRSRREESSANNARRHNRSPYKPNRYGNDIEHSERNTSPFKVSESRNTSPYKVDEHRNISPYRAKHVSPYRTRQNEIQEVANLNVMPRNGTREIPQASQRTVHSQSKSISRANERESSRLERSPSPLARTISVGRSPSPLVKTVIHKEHKNNELNETIANAELSKSPITGILIQSTDSVSLSDIFVSRIEKEELTIKNIDKADKFVHVKTFPEKYIVNQTPEAISVVSVLPQTNNSTPSAFGQLTNSRSTTYSGKFSDSSKLSASFKKITAIGNKGQTDTWLSCVRGGSCARSKSPGSRAINEASFIGRALVVEELKPFWADKHGPCTLSKFIFHKQQAQILQQLISHGACPHILFRGHSGSGKKSLTMGLLHDIFGDSSLKTYDELRHFHVQEARSLQFAIPLTSSRHHVEINLKFDSDNARYALMALVKEMTRDHTHSPDVSDVSFRTDYKVIILYNFNKVADNLQHLIKWIMDRYTDTLKIIICCENDVDIIDSVKTRCELINVDTPSTHEITEILVGIAKKENFELSLKFASRIATKSRKNLRRAIMALEACKLHNYPFVDDQPIPLGWEDLVIEVAEEILADPSNKRLFFVRGKLQKLLVEFVHPKLILQKLVEHILKRVEPSLKRDLYYWLGYYEKKLPVGTSALLKLEEFVAKFMSIYRKSTPSRSYSTRTQFV